MTPAAPLSLNARAAALADALVADAALLRVGVTHGPGGETVVDCGLHDPGSLEAGLRLARICLGGLGEVALLPSPSGPLPWSVLVRTPHPRLACLGSQYAGWHLHADDGSALLGSGPARALARRESAFDDLPHRESADRAVLVLEGSAPPGDALAAGVASACELPRDRLILLHARTGSLAGTVQIVARVLECAIQKAWHLGHPVDRIQEAIGTAPVAPPHQDDTAAMGCANDAIIYAGRVHLLVTGPADQARDLARALPSRTSPEWGRSFASVYEEAGGDFARIDPGLFSPAEVVVTAVETGDSFRAGRTDPDRLHGPMEAD